MSWDICSMTATQAMSIENVTPSGLRSSTVIARVGWVRVARVPVAPVPVAGVPVAGVRRPISGVANIKNGTIPSEIRTRELGRELGRELASFDLRFVIWFTSFDCRSPRLIELVRYRNGWVISLFCGPPPLMRLVNSVFSSTSDVSARSF